MDFDTLYREFLDLKRRVEPMLRDYESHMAGRTADRDEPTDAERRAEVERALKAGDLDRAGKAAGLERSHGGEEDDESYERRLRAHVVGAEEADAVHPRAGAVAEEELKDE